MAGVTIDPSLAGFSTETQQGQQAIPAGGVVIGCSSTARSTASITCRGS